MDLKKIEVLQLSGGGKDQSCEISQLFFSNGSFPKYKTKLGNKSINWA